MTEKLDAEAISKLVNEQLKTFQSNLAVESKAIDEHRIVVTCTEYQQRQISRSLATLGK